MNFTFLKQLHEFLGVFQSSKIDQSLRNPEVEGCDVITILYDNYFSKIVPFLCKRNKISGYSDSSTRTDSHLWNKKHSNTNLKATYKFFCVKKKIKNNKFYMYILNIIKYKLTYTCTAINSSEYRKCKWKVLKTFLKDMADKMAIPVVCKHCYSVNVMELSQSFSFTCTPYISDQNLDSLVKGNCWQHHIIKCLAKLLLFLCTNPNNQSVSREI